MQLNNLLAFADIMQSVLYVFVAILVLLVMITVHEFGHYIVGKIFKFKILEFAIGMGPAIFKKTLKNGEIFSIRIFPLGGFCQFEGEDDAATVEDDKNSLNDEKPVFEGVKEVEGEDKENEKPKLSKDAFNNKKPYQRILVLIAGAVFNFIFALLLVTINLTAYGMSAISPLELKPASNEIESHYLLKEGDVIVKANGKFIFMTTDLLDALDGKKKGDLVSLSVKRDGKLQDVTISLREDVNSSSLEDVTPCYDALGFATIPMLTTKEGSPFKNNSYLLKFNDNEDYSLCTRIYSVNDVIDRLSSMNAGEILSIYVSVLEERELVEITLDQEFENINKEDRTAILEYLKIEKSSRYYSAETQRHRFGFFEGLIRAPQYAFKVVSVTFRSVAQIIQGKLSLNSVTGPVGMISMTSQIVSYGFDYLLEVAAIIGMSLAIFNILPIPALDGARAVFVLIEWIFKKPVNKNVEGMIHFVGLILLLAFAIFVDVIKFI